MGIGKIKRVECIIIGDRKGGVKLRSVVDMFGGYWENKTRGVYNNW